MRGWQTHSVAVLAASALCVVGSVVHAETVWPQFRGPGGQGHSSANGLPLEWSESTNVAWKTPIVGQGWSSPVVAGGRVWLTAATQVQATEEERAAKTDGRMGAERCGSRKS